jgi:membrane-bound lytic murein transglycosylase B
MFVALLVAAVVVGRVIVPAGGPSAGATPPVQSPSTSPTTAPTTSPGVTGLPQLPTPQPRPADALAGWAQRVSDAIKVPEVAVQAYGFAQLSLQQTDPNCHVTWTTLAGIAQVESTHGQAGGAVLEPGGRSTPPIAGPLLDGRDGRALVRDTDAGAFDGDATYDRTMGPLRLLPTVWRAQAIDADADGILDPYDIDDASLALARLLCSGTEDLGRRAGWTAAVERYRNTAGYARSVFREADNYGQLTRSVG